MLSGSIQIVLQHIMIENRINKIEKLSAEQWVVWLSAMSNDIVTGSIVFKKSELQMNNIGVLDFGERNPRTK